MSDFYVYALFRPWDGSPFYIGKGRGRRWLHHESRSNGPNKIVRDIITKARRLNLEIPKIKIRENLPEKTALEVEIALIAAIGRMGHGGPLANRGPGGDRGPTEPKSAEHKAKISAALKGHPPHLESLAKIREMKIGKPLSVEHREKLSLAAKARCARADKSPQR